MLSVRYTDWEERGLSDVCGVINKELTAFDIKAYLVSGLVRCLLRAPVTSIHMHRKALCLGQRLQMVINSFIY